MVDFHSSEAVRRGKSLEDVGHEIKADIKQTLGSEYSRARVYTREPEQNAGRSRGPAKSERDVLICRRTRRSRLTGRRGKVTYQVWLVFDLHVDAAADSAAVAPELAVDPVLSADSAGDLGEHLQDAGAEVAGDRTGR